MHRALKNQNLEINSLTSESMLAFLCIGVSYFMQFIVLCAMRQYAFCFVKIYTKYTVNHDITNAKRRFHILHAILSFLNINYSLVRTLCFSAFTIKQVMYN